MIKEKVLCTASNEKKLKQFLIKTECVGRVVVIVHNNYMSVNMCVHAIFVYLLPLISEITKFGNQTHFK